MKSPSPIKLPMNTIVTEAFLFIYKNYGLLITRLFLTGCIIICLKLLSKQTHLLIGELKQTLYLLTFIVSHTLFAITSHRLVLLDSKSVPKFGILTWSSREWHFLGLLIGSALFLKLISMLFEWMSDFLATIEKMGLGIEILLIFLVIFPGFYFFARLVLLFPAIASDKKLTWAQVFNATQNNGWRLLSFIFLFPVAYGFILDNLYGYGLALDLFLAFLGLAFMFFILTIISLSFKYLCGFETKPDVEKNSAFCRESEK